jgi:succinate dehydrogenase/fumarate reductase flavoprotein subunit
MTTHASLRVLVVAGGFAGMSTAVELHKRGAEVDLFEIDPGWRLCQIEIEDGSMDEHAQIMRDSLMALAQPI